MKARSNGIDIHYTLDGPADAPVVMMSHSLAASGRMWDAQMPALRDYRVLRFDTRGHGQSSVPGGPYDLDTLADDAYGLLDALDIGQVLFVGLSMGGMIGQVLALKHPDRLACAVLCDTSSHMPAEARPAWMERIALVEREGMEAVVEGTIDRWFNPGFVNAHPEAVEPVRAMIRATPAAGYAGCIHAISRIDVTEKLRSVSVPVQVICGEDDPSTPVAASEAIHAAIPGSELVLIPDARHFVNIEQAEAFNAALTGFLKRHT
jgi:3-oxoadipate enol-lactonase